MQFLLGDENHTVTASEHINDAFCAREVIAPLISFYPHTAPLDLKFNADGTEGYVSLHGSW